MDRHLTRRSPESAESLLCGRSRRPATGHGVHLHRASGIRPDRGGGRRGSRSRPYGSTCDVSVARPGPGHLPTSSLSHGDGRRTGRRWDRRRRREPGGSRGRGSRAISGFGRILAGDRSRYPKHALGPAREPARGLAHLLRDGPRPYPAEPSWTDSRFERDSCRSCGGDRGDDRRHHHRDRGRGGGRRRVQPRLPGQFRVGPLGLDPCHAALREEDVQSTAVGRRRAVRGAGRLPSRGRSRRRKRRPPVAPPRHRSVSDALCSRCPARRRESGGA